MTSWLLPDVNVWVALHHVQHQHHQITLGWFKGLREDRTLVFCRQTQLGLFRLLTTAAVMGDETITQHQCWTIYSKWVAGGRAVQQPEPAAIDRAFRARTLAAEPAPKTWMDAYLAAFAETSGLTLVTFDKALAAKAKGALLLH
jgi:toxin-antitoxin system PIN domain toxin